MMDTIAEILLTKHLVEGKLEKGTGIGLSIAQVLTQEANGIAVYPKFESLGTPS